MAIGKSNTGKDSEKTTAEETKTVTDAAETATEESIAGAAGEGENVRLSGRSVFSIETTSAGVVVRTAFLTEDMRLLEMPMVFPDIMYAFDVIDDLKRQVAQHFSNAARAGRCCPERQRR